MCLDIKLFVGSQVPSAKNWMKNKKKLRTFPSYLQEKSDKLRNENIQQVRTRWIFLKSCKISNMNIEILRSHEADYVTATIITLILLNRFLVLVAPNFRNRWKKCQKKNWMFFGRVFARLRGILMAHCQFTKAHQRNPSESRQWSFPSLAAALSKRFSTISDSTFKEANKALEHLQKTSEKHATIAGVIEPVRNGQKPISNEQMEKLLDNGELGRAESKNAAKLQRTTQFFVSLFFGRSGQGIQRQLTPTIQLYSLRKKKH